MRVRSAVLVTALGLVATSGAVVRAQAPATAPAAGDRPYRILRTERVGGEGLWDYIYADVPGRRLYIPRRAPVPGAAGPAATTRLSVYNLDTLALVAEIDGVGGNGATVDPKSGHGFTSSKPVSMFDTKTLKPITTIDVGDAVPDGIYLDPFNAVSYTHLTLPTKA